MQAWTQRLYFDVVSTFKLDLKSTENRRRGATSTRRQKDVEFAY